MMRCPFPGCGVLKAVGTPWTSHVRCMDTHLQYIPNNNYNDQDLLVAQGHSILNQPPPPMDLKLDDLPPAAPEYNDTAGPTAPEEEDNLVFSPKNPPSRTLPTFQNDMNPPTYCWIIAIH